MGSLIQTRPTWLWRRVPASGSAAAAAPGITAAASVAILQGSLAMVFVWFGLLKLLGVSPMRETILAVVPFVKSVPAFYTALALFEIGAGLGLLFPRTVAVAAVLMLGHLTAASLAVLISPIAWEPAFPYLSLMGEFVAKNLVLAAAALLILRSESASRGSPPKS